MEEYFNDMEVAITEQEEKALYRKAKKRVQFKVHLMIFFLTNLLLWLLLGFGSKLFSESFNLENPAFQFALFVSLTWGVLVVAHYLIIYKWGKSYVEKELNTLKKEYKKNRLNGKK